VTDPAPVRFVDLPAWEQRELRRIRAELAEFPFVDRTWLEPEPAREGGFGTGRGARYERRYRNNDCPFTPGAGGCPVFHEIGGGTRHAVQRALERFELGGRETRIVTRARRVARWRHERHPRASAPWLPIEAGDDPLTPPSPRAAAVAARRLRQRRQAAARRAWETMRAKGIKPTAPAPRPPVDPARRASALKAWATMRAAAAARETCQRDT